MAKKKALQQLDLFADLFAAEPIPTTNEVEEQAAASVVQEEQVAFVAAETVNTTEEVLIEEPPTITEQPAVVSVEEAPPNNVVFKDDKISVKIKLKPPVVPATTETQADAEIKPVLQAKQEEEIATTTVTKIKNESQKVKRTSVNIEGAKNKRGRKSFKEMDAEIELVNIPPDEVLKKKLYYPIREVASFFNVNTSLIRAWETEFDILKPRKNRKGDRLFRFEDIKNLQVIYYLLRNKKFSVDGAKKYLKENKTNPDASLQTVQTLNRLKHFLLSLKQSLSVTHEQA